MALSNEWVEYHLTENGWIKGSHRLDIVGVTERNKPANSVITRKYKEYASSRFSGLEMTYTESISTNDFEKRTALLKKYPHPEPISQYEKFSLQE